MYPVVLGQSLPAGQVMGVLADSSFCSFSSLFLCAILWCCVSLSAVVINAVSSAHEKFQLAFGRLPPLFHRISVTKKIELLLSSAWPLSLLGQ